MSVDELWNYELTHQHGGNGYACVEIIDSEWIRITSKFCEAASRNRAWLVWMKKISMFEMQGERRKLTEEELENLQPIRAGITTGKLKVVGTHVVPAK